MPARHLAYSKDHCHAAPPQVRQTAYEVLVRPTLEVATCAWTPHTKTGIQTIERVQRSAARFISCVSDMCTNLMWNSLYTQRRIRDVIMFKKNSPRTNAHAMTGLLISGFIQDGVIYFHSIQPAQ